MLALATLWGLFRYYWVSAKFWLTLATTVASIFALTARLHDAADAVARHPVGPISAMDLGFIRYNMVIVPAVALLLYLANVILSYLQAMVVDGRPRPAQAGSSVAVISCEASLFYGNMPTDLSGACGITSPVTRSPAEP